MHGTKKKKTSLQYSVDKGEVEVVKLLLEFGANVNMRDSNNEIPLFSAIIGGNTDIVKLLIDHGYFVELKKVINGFTPLVIADSYNYDDRYFEICKLLLENGANANAQIDTGNTPLHFLVSNADLKTVKLFLDFKVNVNLRNERGEIPLFNAVKSNNVEVVQLLLDHGSDVNTVNTKFESTLLHVACEYKCSIEIIKSLLRKGLDVNALDIEACTPLMRFWWTSDPNPASLTLLLGNTDFSFLDVSGNNALCFYNPEFSMKIIIEHIAKFQVLDVSLHPSILEAI